MSEESMFVLDSSTKESTPSKFLIIDKEDDFIQEGVIIKSLEVDPEEEKYFQITAEKEGQLMQTQRQWFPEKERAASEESYKKSVSIKKGLLASLLRKFQGGDANIQASSWPDFVRKIDEACKAHYADTPLRVKLELVENKGKYYTNISTFAPFESLTIPTSESQMKITAKDKQMLRNKIEEERITPDTDTSTSSQDDSPF